MSKVRADNYSNRLGTGAPDFPDGLNVTGTAATFSGNVSIAGTLTYQDVSNIDSVGMVTARKGIQVLADGINAVGIVTATSFSGDGSSLTGIDATSLKDSGGNVKAQANPNGVVVTGVLTATSFSGDGSSLTGISATPVIGTDTSSPNNQFVFLDLDNAQDHKLIASGITTISCTGGKEGDSHTVRITNSGITTIGFTTAFLFPSGASPSMPTADGTLSLISFTINKAGTAGTELFTGASLNFS